MIAGIVTLGQYGEINGGVDNRVHVSKWRRKKPKELGDIYAYFNINRIIKQIRQDCHYIINEEKKILIYLAPKDNLKSGLSKNNFNLIMLIYPTTS